jgi:hypothetical protein
VPRRFLTWFSSSTVVTGGSRSATLSMRGPSSPAIAWPHGSDR